MEFISTQKYIRVSPKKIRPLAREVSKLRPQEAIDTLPFAQKKGASYLAKVIKTAAANAKGKGVDITDLFIKEIQVMEGPRLKRGIPASRGRWHPIIKRMSHIKVILALKEKKQGRVESQKVKKSREKNVKKNSAEALKKVKK